MILIAAKLQIAQDLVRYAAALLIGVALFHIIDAARVLMIDGADHRAERVCPAKQTADAVPAVKAAPGAHLTVIHRGAAQRLVAGTYVRIEKRRAPMFRTGSGYQIDRAAERLRVHVRSRRLRQLNAADDAGGKGIEGNRAAATRGGGSI